MINVGTVAFIDHSRQKIKAICSSQTPVLDEQHPEILEEARFWLLTSATRTKRDTVQASASTGFNVATNASAVMGLTSELSDSHVAASSLAGQKMLLMAESHLPALICWQVFVF